MMLSLIMPTVDSNYIAFVFVYHRHCLSPMPLSMLGIVLCVPISTEIPSSSPFGYAPVPTSAQMPFSTDFYFSISANRPEQCRCSDANLFFRRERTATKPISSLSSSLSPFLEVGKLKWKTLKFSRGMRWLWWHFVFAADTFMTRSDDVPYWLWGEIKKKCAPNVRRTERERDGEWTWYWCSCVHDNVIRTNKRFCANNKISRSAATKPKLNENAERTHNKTEFQKPTKK